MLKIIELLKLDAETKCVATLILNERLLGTSLRYEIVLQIFERSALMIKTIYLGTSECLGNLNTDES